MTFEDFPCAFTGEEARFIAENEELFIIPNTNIAQLELICGTFGPFKPPLKAKVPLWVGIAYKQMGKCSIEPPRWLLVEELEGILETEKMSGELTSIPFYFYEIASLLVKHAPEDIPNLNSVRKYMEGIKQTRKKKYQTIALEYIHSHVPTKLNNLSFAEQNAVKIMCRNE